MLSKSSRKLIDIEILKYPKEERKAAVMAALRIIQSECGYLSAESIKEVADYLNIPEIKVYEIASFYSMYDLEKPGKHKIMVCTGISCCLRGAEKTLNHLEEKMSIKAGETRSDGMYTLQEVACCGSCVDAPVVLHNNHKMLEKMDVNRVDNWFKKNKL